MSDVNASFNELVIGHLKEHGAQHNFDSVYTLVAIAKSSALVDQSLCDPKNAASLIEKDGALPFVIALARAFEAKKFNDILCIDTIRAKSTSVAPPPPRICEPPHLAPPPFHYARTPPPVLQPRLPMPRDTEQSLRPATDDTEGCTFRTPFKCVWDTVKSCWASTGICCVRSCACLDKNCCCCCDEQTMRDVDTCTDVLNCLAIGMVVVEAAAVV